MNTYLVTHDLRVHSSNYEDFSQKIRSFPKWARISPYSWLIQTDDNVSDVRSEIREAINSAGLILVIDVTSANWATYAVSKEVTSWMKDNM